MKISHGSTRTVLLTKKYAIKIPSFVEYKLFLQGLLANMQEVAFSKTGWPELCPVLFYIPFGIITVMPRCEPLTREQFDKLDYFMFTLRENYVLTFVEHKIDSFGILNGKIVAVDYGY